jgi:RNA polymerase-interacting CarD/CdnL/TRCF family regulator
MVDKGPEIPIGDGSLHIGDRVVYPNQGICRITGVEVKQIAGRDWEVVTLSREEDGATVMVPRAKVMGIGLRKVASVEAIDDLFDQLAAPSDDPQLDWKVRHRENADRMTGGGLQGTLDVLKGLHALSRVRPLPQKERELYDNARHLLIGEIAAAMNLPLHVAEDNLDYALFPPPGMKRKGAPLKPPTLALPGSSVGVGRGRASDGDDDLGFEQEEEEAAPRAAAGAETEPADAVAADEEESDIADRSETKDLVRQRAMRVAAEEEEPEALDELAADALEATHEEDAAQPSERVRAAPGESGPPPRRGPPGSGAPAKAPRPVPAEKPPANLAKAIAAKALQAAAKAIAPAKDEKGAPRHAAKKAAPPPRPAAKKPTPAKKPAAPKKAAAAKKPARKVAPPKKAKGKR